MKEYTFLGIVKYSVYYRNHGEPKTKKFTSEDEYFTFLSEIKRRKDIKVIENITSKKFVDISTSTTEEKLDFSIDEEMEKLEDSFFGNNNSFFDGISDLGKSLTDSSEKLFKNLEETINSNETKKAIDKVHRQGKEYIKEANKSVKNIAEKGMGFFKDILNEYEKDTSSKSQEDIEIEQKIKILKKDLEVLPKNSPAREHIEELIKTLEKEL